MPRDHGGGLDAAIAKYGGSRDSWIDLSTGINPSPFPIPEIGAEAWTALPDQQAEADLIQAARAFWGVPDGADILAAPGASALIARIPTLAPAGCAEIKGPTYNEHAAAFLERGWTVEESAEDARVVVHPNNPDGRLASAPGAHGLTVIDESFCDIMPGESLIAYADRPGVLVLKSFGKFWGLAGARLGFAIGDPALVGGLRQALGPWPVSGPAIGLGTAALCDTDWAETTRVRLENDAARLDAMMQRAGAGLAGGTSLFRLYEVGDAAAWQAKLARRQIWSRIFPYSKTWLRLGLPPAHGWDQLEAVL